TIEFLDTGTGYQILTKKPGYIRAKTIHAEEREDKEKTTTTNINLNVGGFMPKMPSFGGQKPGANTAAAASSASAGSGTGPAAAPSTAAPMPPAGPAAAASSASAPHAAAAKPGEAPKAERDPLLKGSASFSRSTSSSTRTAYANIGASVEVDADAVHGSVRRDATAFSETKKEEHFEGVFIPLMDLANAKEKIKRDYDELSDRYERFMEKLKEQAKKIAAKFRSKDDLEADEGIVINGKDKTRIKVEKDGKDGKAEVGSKEKTKPKNKTKSDSESDMTETFDDAALDDKKSKAKHEAKKNQAHEKAAAKQLKDTTKKILIAGLKEKLKAESKETSDKNLSDLAENFYSNVFANKSVQEVLSYLSNTSPMKPKPGTEKDTEANVKANIGHGLQQLSLIFTKGVLAASKLASFQSGLGEILPEDMTAFARLSDNERRAAQFVIGTGAGFLRTGQGIKQLGLRMGETFGWANAGATEAYTKEINESWSFYQSRAAGKSKSGKAGEIFSGVAISLAIPGGAGLRGIQLIKNSAAVGAATGFLQPTQTADDNFSERLENMKMGGILGAGGAAFSIGLGGLFSKNLRKAYEKEAIQTFDDALNSGKKFLSSFQNSIKNLYDPFDSYVFARASSSTASKAGGAPKPKANDFLHFFESKSSKPKGYGKAEAPTTANIGSNFRKYEPTPKHAKNSFGSFNPIPDQATGQKLLATAYSSAEKKQLYNVYNGKLIKFQPDNTLNNGWHAYEVEAGTSRSVTNQVPLIVLKKMCEDGLITRIQYNKWIKNK
ncbi:MAG: hypothetical protein ACKOAD_06415, partial [Gammaproteobacteria bacterium]